MIQENARGAEAAVNQFSVATTSSVLDRNETFPMATVPDFSRRAAALSQEIKGASMENLDLFFFLPVVRTLEERAAWEKYSIENIGQIAENQKAEGINYGFNTIDFFPPTPYIWNFAFSTDESGALTFENARASNESPWLPAWQTYPVVLENIVNEDWGPVIGGK